MLVALAGFALWAYTPSGPMPEGLAALGSDTQVEVEIDGWFTFWPSKSLPTTGLILYPGGRVDARAYAPTARQVAAQGYLVVIVPMPLNLAVFGASRAERVVDAHPQIEHWAIGGYSLGGAMAARFISTHPDMIDGLVLWASYPASGSSLADRDVSVVSIYGTEDGLATLDEIEASRSLLPEETRWAQISGANHAGFGWYGAQVGDGEATIDRADQQAQIIDITWEFLNHLSEARP